MDKPLALEYSGEKKWYSYRMFEPLQDGQSDSESSRKFDRSKQVRFEVSSLASGEEEKENHNEHTNSDDSFWSSSSNQDKLDSDYCKTNYESLRNEIKELRNDLKTWMEKIAAPLNIIANFITQNHAQKFESTIRESSIPTPENAQEINQVDVVIHTVEDYQKVRDKYPFETFVRNELAHFDSKSKKVYSKMLKLADNYEPLAFFLF